MSKHVRRLHTDLTRMARRVHPIGESVFSEMSRLAAEHGAVNLSQGFPDFPAPALLKQAATEAIARDLNQYAPSHGSARLRKAIAAKSVRTMGIEWDPEREITVTCGSTEGMIATLMATVDPGEEVVIFEPFYENYAPDAILSGAKPVYVRLHAPAWTFDPDELRAALSTGQ